MSHLLSYEFNIDTACVELIYSDKTKLSIYTLGVDEAMDITTKQQSKVDWLIYNDPITYVKKMNGFHSLND